MKRFWKITRLVDICEDVGAEVFIFVHEYDSEFIVYSYITLDKETKEELNTFRNVKADREFFFRHGPNESLETWEFEPIFISLMSPVEAAKYRKGLL